MKFFTSDNHFNHMNIIAYENRPFDDVETMNRCMIRRWNEKVRDKDEVYILGDFLFGNGEMANETLKQLKGTKHLIMGNHDYFVKHKDFDKNLFKWIKDYHVIKENKRKIILFHYPIQRFDCCHHGSIHLHGHIHSNELEYPIKNVYNVGVDVNDFEPKTLFELIGKVDKYQPKK